MVISYVVRLRPDALSDGRFVGEIEAVTSRQRSSVRTLDQIAAFILATMPSQVCTASSARQIAMDDFLAGDGGDPRGDTDLRRLLGRRHR
jgi:hypothetical protein